MVILNQYTVSMYYSTPRSAVEMPEIWTRLDWSCAKVMSHTCVLCHDIQFGGGGGLYIFGSTYRRGKGGSSTFGSSFPEIPRIVFILIKVRLSVC